MSPLQNKSFVSVSFTSQYANDVVLKSAQRWFNVMDVVWTSKRRRILTGLFMVCILSSTFSTLFLRYWTTLSFRFSFKKWHLVQYPNHIIKKFIVFWSSRSKFLNRTTFSFRCSFKKWHLVQYPNHIIKKFIFFWSSRLKFLNRTTFSFRCSFKKWYLVQYPNHIIRKFIFDWSSRLKFLNRKTLTFTC